MKYCIYCGKKLKDDTLFCTSCGKAQASPQSKSAGYDADFRSDIEYDGMSEEDDDFWQDENTRNKFLPFIIILIICAAAAVAVIFLMKYKNLSTEKTEISEEMEMSEGVEEALEPETEEGNTDQNGDDGTEPEIEYYLTFGTTYFTLSAEGEMYTVLVDTNIENLSEIEWTSSDAGVADVDGSGVVTAVASGNAVITASWNDISATCTITCDVSTVHTYEIVTEDVSWSEAFATAKSAGGYLVRIDSQEEYDYIIGIISDGNYTKYHFYLGGRRNSGGTNYYWVDSDNQFMGECLVSSSVWCFGDWYDGEPSYTDSVDGVEIEENVMNLFYVSDTWYLNDASEDLIGNYPDLMAGHVGYIVEFE